MRCLDEIDAILVAMRSGWPIGGKALESLRAQIVLDVAGIKRSVEIINEAHAPHIVVPDVEVE
jgi:hypothetical protein